MAADRTLATAIGVRVDYTMLLTIACGSALAGIAGFLVACDTAITPSTGFAVLLTAVTVAIIGGIGSIRGAMLGVARGYRPTPRSMVAYSSVARCGRIPDTDRVSTGKARGVLGQIC